jgi:hypothetical protein
MSYQPTKGAIMKENQHVQAMPSAVFTQAQIKIDEARALLAPYLLALTPAERQGVPKMGEKTIGFVEKAYDFARQNPNLVPPYLEVDASALTSATPTAFGPCSTRFSSWKRVSAIRK